MGGWGVCSNILIVKTHQVAPYFKDLEKRIRTVETLACYLNSVQNASSFKF